MLISFISLLVARMNLYRFIAHETLRMPCVIMMKGIVLHAGFYCTFYGLLRNTKELVLNIFNVVEKKFDRYASIFL